MADGWHTIVIIAVNEVVILQELRGEAWTFDEKAITFLNRQLIGGPEDFILWAQENYDFEEFRPEALYQTLTENGYKNHLNSQNVLKTFVFNLIYQTND